MLMKEGAEPVSEHSGELVVARKRAYLIHRQSSMTASGDHCY